MYHAAAKDLDPAFALADAAALALAGEALHVHFGGRFGEGEMMRTEPHHRILAVQALDDRFQAALQVAHGDALIDDKPLDLMEDGGVGGIDGIAAVHAAGRDDADGRLSLLHGADLHRGGLGAQQHLIGDIKGILRIPGGVVRRQVERFKVVVIQLDLRAGDDIKAHAEEDLLDLIQDEIKGMAVALPDRRAGQGDIDGLFFELLLGQGCLERPAAGFQLFFNGGAKPRSHLNISACDRITHIHQLLLLR